MAPERFDTTSGSPVGPAADIFAWGAVVAHAATGRNPFGGDSATATAMRILTQPPDLTGLGGPLRELVSRALEKDPADRPTARELLDGLLTAANPGGSLPGRPNSWVPRRRCPLPAVLTRAVRRRRRVWSRPAVRARAGVAGSPRWVRPPR